jgi:FSR family fosmidomycin resistance protein-like MFS transporter
MVSAISLAHIINDFYVNFIQTILPFLIAAGLGISRGALLITAFTFTSSLTQPVFGYLVDRRSKAWLVYVGTLWMALLLPLIGYIKYYPLLWLVALSAGLGTAAFHPQASSLMGSVNENKRGVYQALFVAMGNIGWSLTPLIVAPFVFHYGMEKSYIFVVPGLLAALVLWRNVPNKKQEKLCKESHTRFSFKDVLLNGGPELFKVIVIIMLRSTTQLSLVAMLPLYLVELNVPLLAGSRLTSLMLIFGALGGIFGGFLSDIFGRKPMVVGMLLFASPVLFGAINTHGILQAILLAAAGVCLISSVSVIVVMGQDIMVENRAVASGLLLGFGMGVGGIGVSLIALVSEYYGMSTAIKILFSLPLLAGLIACSLRTNQTESVVKAS